MEQFRPNLVVTGTRPGMKILKVIRIGSVIFDVVKPCSRCIFTTVSPEKGQTPFRRAAENPAIVPHRAG
ncbi:MOSC domain-containing protein [Enterobacter sp.]|uniref:MOSC domain-containing protein n=1 Tax=Enterobacter sp. TaxID=42895 RepID=UPI0037836C63